MQKTQPNQLIRFGVFEVDPRSGELRNKGSRVKLQDQPLQILLAVLEKPGEVVTREELRARLWPADTFVDFEHGLNAAVKRLGTPWVIQQKIPGTSKRCPGAGIVSSPQRCRRKSTRNRKSHC